MFEEPGKAELDWEPGGLGSALASSLHGEAHPVFIPAFLLFLRKMKGGGNFSYIVDILVVRLCKSSNPFSLHRSPQGGDSIVESSG